MGKRFLAFDTETTGLPWLDRPVSDPSQPRVVQIGAILFDEEGREHEALNTLIAPDGWNIDEDDEPVHPWTTEDCAFMGIPISDAVYTLALMAERADHFVIHHADFDLKMLEIETALIGEAIDPPQWPPALCTMKLATPVCRLPFKPGKFKYPSLQEAALLILGRNVDEDDGLHDAFVDARLCKDIFLELRRQGATPA
jgi:DNA polymerase III subunit epsilon